MIEIPSMMIIVRAAHENNKYYPQVFLRCMSV